MRLKIKRCFFILLLLMFFSASYIMSSAVSVSPGRITLSFVPNAEYEDVAKFGTGGRTNHLRLTSGGDFEIILEKDELFCDQEPCITGYKVIMPESFDKPGRHSGHISATEVFDNAQTGNINVVITMSMSVYIQVPYPGKYLDILDFTAINKEAGEEIPFTVELVSRGDEVIKNVRAVVYIYDRFDEQIGRINTNTRTSVQPEERFSLTGKWDSGDYERGRYHAFVKVIYDDFDTNETTKFKLGGLDVELMGYTKDVLKGGIKPFEVEVESIWSEDIPNMKAGVAVLNNKDEEITSFETITKVLKAWRTETLRGYLDTNNLNLSNYTLGITLFFENSTKDYDGIVRIYEPEPEKPEKGEWLKKIFTIKTLLIVLVILLLVVLGFLIFMFIPKKKKVKKDIKKKKYKKG